MYKATVAAPTKFGVRYFNFRFKNSDEILHWASRVFFDFIVSSSSYLL